MSKTSGYIALVHKDKGTSYGVSFPDVPGCISAGDTFEQAIENASHALVGHLAVMEADGGKGRSLPPNVVTLRASKPRPPSTAAILEGLKLMQVFLRIESGRDRKKVLDLARQLALDDANTR